MTDPLMFCSDSVSHPFVAREQRKEEKRSSHLTWGGVWEMVAKELFSIYANEGNSERDGGIMYYRELGSCVAAHANVIADEMLYKAREYCEEEGIDPNVPLA